MKVKKLLAIVLVILTVAYCGIAFLTYDASSGAEIVCTAGSFAETWAKRHGATMRLIADSELAASRLQLATFDYDLENGGCVIVGCHTASREVVIPEEIDGYPVIGVGEPAFADCPDAEAVYVPETVEFFAPLHTEQYVIYCYESSDTHNWYQSAVAENEMAEALRLEAEAAPALAVAAEEAAQRSEAEAEAAEEAAEAAQKAADDAAKAAAEPEAEEAAVEEAEALAEEAAELTAAAEEKRALADAAAETATQKNEEARELAEQLDAIAPEVFVVAEMQLLHDSDPINFAVADIPFAYNQTASGVELTAYTGQEAQVIVPETIDGILVTAISFPVEEHVQTVWIPASVADIQSPLTEPRYDELFYVNLALVVLGLLVAVCATNWAAKRGKTAEQRFLGVALIYSGVKYFVLLLIWAAIAMIFGLGFWLQIIVGLVLLAAAPIEIAVAGFAAQKVEQTGAEVQKNTMFIRAYRVKAENLEARAGATMKSCCTEVTEAFRYADPVSDASLLAAEEQIAARFETFSSAVLAGNETTARTVANELLALMEERNRTCKLLK